MSGILLVVSIVGLVLSVGEEGPSEHAILNGLAIFALVGLGFVVGQLRALGRMRKRIHAATDPAIRALQQSGRRNDAQVGALARLNKMAEDYEALWKVVGTAAVPVVVALIAAIVALAN